MSDENLTRRERERRERAEQDKKQNQKVGAILAGVVIFLPLALLPMCSSGDGTPVNNLRDSGVQISNSDYKALCKSNRGEWGHGADLSGYGYTDDDMSRILATIAEDPSCQPDR